VSHTILRIRSTFDSLATALATEAGPVMFFDDIIRVRHESCERQLCFCRRLTLDRAVTSAGLCRYPVKEIRARIETDAGPRFMPSGEARGGGPSGSRGRRTSNRRRGGGKTAKIKRRTCGVKLALPRTARASMHGTGVVISCFET